MPYRLLTEFEQLFAGHPYLHRNPSLGDFVAMHLYEDLAELNLSAKLRPRIESGSRVLSTANLRQGVSARRGDGTLGEIVPGTPTVSDSGFLVARGKVATVEIGDLQKQVAHFRRGGGNPICVAIVDINHAAYTIGYEGERAFRTGGKANRHPIQEATEAERRLLAQAAPAYDEFAVLHYSATNESPFPFAWVNYDKTFADYGAALVRISREYDRRF